MSEFNNFEENDQVIIEETKEENKPKKKSLYREVLEWICSIAVAFIIAMILRNHVFILARVDGESMLPTLHHNERLVVWRLGYKPEAGDIVILEPPSGRGPYVKRVIATGGQTIKINNLTGDVFVDGEKLDEPYINNKTTSMQSEFYVPEGHSFVMGDNRGNSHDSRSSDVSFIADEKILGEVVFRLWPLDTVGTVE